MGGFGLKRRRCWQGPPSFRHPYACFRSRVAHVSACWSVNKIDAMTLGVALAIFASAPFFLHTEFSFTFSLIDLTTVSLCFPSQASERRTLQQCTLHMHTRGSDRHLCPQHSGRTREQYSSEAVSRTELASLFLRSSKTKAPSIMSGSFRAIVASTMLVISSSVPLLSAVFSVCCASVLCTLWSNVNKESGFSFS